MRSWVAGLVAGGLLLSGCAGNGSSRSGESTAPEPPQQATVLVSAAASLTDVFSALEQPFEQANPGADLQFNFGSSSDLAQQIVNGAPADVFASANETQLKVVSDAGLTDGPGQIFATNVLTIVVPPGNPQGITSFADLAGPDVTEVVCAPQVPCGAATEKIEAATGTQLSPASEEQDVRAVLAKVVAGEADAGLVYVTDAASAAGKVEQITFAEADTAINKYPITALKNAPQPQYAQAFVDFVLGPQGQQALAEAGFGKA